MVLQEEEELLTVEHLSKRFGDSLVLSDISFQLAGNEILGLIGPNGAGKSTLMECVSGLLPADTGIVSSKGKRVSQEARKELMFYLPDQVSLYAEQYTIDVLSFFAEALSFGKRGKNSDELKQAIERLELAPVLTKPIGKLSKGYERRMLLAVALLAKQQILLLDEPFDGLDLRQTRQAMDLIKDMKKCGRSLLLSIHQIADAERICDRFLLLSNGSMLGSGTLAELRAKAAAVDNSGLEDIFLALT